MPSRYSRHHRSPFLITAPDGTRDLAPFLDRDGLPLPAVLQRVLAGLAPRLRRQFPQLRDDAVQLQILETAGQRVARRLVRAPVDRLHGYTWVAIRTGALSHLRRTSERLAIDYDANLTSRPGPAGSLGSPEALERDVTIREVLRKMPRPVRRMILLKQAGYSAREIAARLGQSPAAVDTAVSRALRRLRNEIGRPVPHPQPKTPRCRSAGTTGARDLPPSHPLPLNCPYCGVRLAFISEESAGAFYQCARHGRLVLASNGRLRRYAY
jgi:DNA-directed RNA polymerase specialized sigma24 family protein